MPGQVCCALGRKSQCRARRKGRERAGPEQDRSKEKLERLLMMKSAKHKKPQERAKKKRKKYSVETDLYTKKTKTSCENEADM